MSSEIKIASVYDACNVVEGFDGEEHSREEQVAAVQYLIDCGAAWSLQGFYGRLAHQLIASGECSDTLGVLAKGGAK